MWTRNPTDRLPIGRLALEYPSNDLDLSVASALTQSLGGEAHWCLGASPIAHPLDEPSPFQAPCSCAVSSAQRRVRRATQTDLV